MTISSRASAAYVSDGHRDELLAGSIVEALRSRSMNIYELVARLSVPPAVLIPILDALVDVGRIVRVTEDGTTVFRYP